MWVLIDLTPTAEKKNNLVVENNNISSLSSVRSLEAALVRTLLPNEAFAQFQSGAVARKLLEPFAATLKKISAKYLERGAGGKVPPFGEVEAKAYALYFMPINFAKIFSVLGNLPGNFYQGDVTALDFGCGPGSASLAMAAMLPRVQIDAFDHSKAMLSLAATLFRAFREESGPAGEGSVGLRPCSSMPGSDRKYNLIIAANVINEFEADGQEETLQTLITRLSEGGVLIVIDPALQETTRRLMALRDRILAGNAGLIPLFPCTRQDACPMLKCSQTDWCHTTMHEGIGWQRPALVKALDEMIGFNKHQIKYAAFIFQKGGTLNEGCRVILPPAKERRGTSALLCGRELYGQVVLPKSARSENNSEFSRLKSFERVRIEGAGADLILSRESIVKRDR